MDVRLRGARPSRSVAPNSIRAGTYVELYGAYTECEAVYSVDHLLELSAAMGPEDRALLAVDPRIVEWDHYITTIHLPSVVEHGRARSSPTRGRGTTRTERLRTQVLAPQRHMAAFDLENTLIASNVVTSYSWLATRRLSTSDRVRFALRTLAEAPSLLAQDRADRSDFLRSFYRRYEGAPIDQLDEDALEHFSEVLLARSFPAAIRRVREHRALGHRTVLITGALDVVIAPLRPLFDDVVCAELGTAVDPDGRRVLTGQLDTVPPTTEARARILADYCDAEGLSLAESVAYADSSSDLPDARSGRIPGGGQPRTPVGVDRTQARLADRGLPHRTGLLAPDPAHRSPSQRRRPGADDEGAEHRTGPGTIRCGTPGQLGPQRCGRSSRTPPPARRRPPGAARDPTGCV